MDRTIYDSINELEANHWWFVARRRIIASLIKRFLPGNPDPELMEAGCGSGGNLPMLAQFGRLDAFEYDATAREHASKKSGLDVQPGALPHEIPFAPKNYDLIGLFDVLEHIESDAEALTALAGRLKDGGRLLVTVPAYQFLWSQHDVRNHHFRRYSRSTLEAVVQKAGLKLVYISYFNTFLFPLAAAARLVKNMVGSDAPDDKMPGRLVNALFTRIFAAESFLLGRIRLPFGLSL
ncbi:MAG: class I SAM-dependent methyltransferase, partial [Tabrizicola sp.]|nr:class I SAM-dependent methyltransferase [Tabrizicola sp.]